MQVHEIMTRDVETITPEESLHDAAEKMRCADSGVIPVVTPDGTVVGMLTDRDIVVRAIADGKDPHGVRVGEAMTADPVTCRPDCPVDAAANTMRERKIRRLLITEEHNKNVVGIVSLGDIAARAHETELVGQATECIAQAAC